MGGPYISAIPDWAYYDFAAPEDRVGAGAGGLRAVRPDPPSLTASTAERWLMGWINPMSDVIPYDDGGRRLSAQPQAATPPGL
jgi:hypothetical protein